jgi:hypothetical protein
MSIPVAEWSEDDVLLLPLGESDEFERKGARALDLTISNVREADVRDELAKQLSAFANTGGGQIIYGLDNNGNVDNGGIARVLRGRQSTKEWLEDVIPNLTDFEIIGFNVYEIRPKATASSISEGKSLYVVHVPDSERAPHQSKRDLKYYVRLGGKSQPASHRLIEDIRNRATHPRIEVHDLQVVSAGAISNSRLANLKSEFELGMGIRFGVRNTGRVRASSSCIQVSGTIPLNVTHLSSNDHIFRAASEGTTLIELKNPLYPGMGIVLKPGIAVPATVEVCSTGESLVMGGATLDSAQLVFTVFADSAPAREQRFPFNEIAPESVFTQVILEQARRIRDQRPYPFSDGGPSGPDSWMA